MAACHTRVARNGRSEDLLDMRHIVSERFVEWTTGRTEVEARIRVFEGIRDIPYAVVPELLDSETGPARMLQLNQGSCQPKHFLLEEMYTRLGIRVLYARYPFRWDEIEVEYPPGLLALARKMPLCHHLACKAVIDDRLVLVDATVDPPLERLGLRVNTGWDGVSSQTLPLRPDGEELYHPSEKGVITPPELGDVELEFYSQMNRLLDGARSGAHGSCGSAPV